MDRFASSLLSVMLAASFCLGQSGNAAQASQPPAQTSPSASPSMGAAPEAAKGHGVMPVELAKSLDSKKLKEGDTVTGRVAGTLHLKDGTLIPAGSKVTGHVTEAKARSKGDASSALGIVFDSISVPGGKNLAIKGVLQAVAANPNGNPELAPPGVIGPGMMAGHDQGASAGTSPPPMPTQNPNQGTGRPVLTGQSKGVVGIHNLELGQDGVLFSNGKEVRLDTGTQFMLQVEIE